MRAFFSFLLTASPVFSITLADLVLAVGIFILIFRILKGIKIQYPEFFPWLLAYSFISLVSAALSINPLVSLPDTKELFVFLIPPVAMLGERKWLKNGIILGASLAAFLGILRILIVRQQRLTGFVGHYMTEGGVMMISFLFILALLLFERFSPINLIALGIILTALILTLTRSAWVGTVAGVALLLYWKKKWAPLLLVPVIFVSLLIAPSRVKERALSIFSLKNVTNVERLNMWRIGLRIFRERPLFGVGQNMVSRIYPEYNKENLQPTEIPHLHNNIVQIGVERGIFALLLFLGFLVKAVLELLKLKDGGALTPEAMGAIAVILGFFVAGLFEYNFGDSEVKLLFLAVLTIPFVEDYKEEIYDKNT